MIKKYKMRPIEIEAAIWEGNNDDEMLEFADDKAHIYNRCLFLHLPKKMETVNIDEYVIKDGKGNLSIMKPEAFKKLYEECK